MGEVVIDYLRDGYPLDFVRCSDVCPILRRTLNADFVLRRFQVIDTVHSIKDARFLPPNNAIIKVCILDCFLPFVIRHGVLVNWNTLPVFVTIEGFPPLRIGFVSDQFTALFVVVCFPRNQRAKSACVFGPIRCPFVVFVSDGNILPVACTYFPILCFKGNTGVISIAAVIGIVQTIGESDSDFNPICRIPIQCYCVPFANIQLV